MKKVRSSPLFLAATVLVVSLLAGGFLGPTGAFGQESDPGAPPDARLDSPPDVQPEGRPEPRPDAAFLFAYRPNPGQEASFRAGYRRHLDWHREHGDPLIWYGWEVLTGDRPGLFVDGVFGAPFSALDHRVDPAGDVADMNENVAPFVRPVFRMALRVRSELGTASPLEDGDPSPLVTVVRVQLRPGTGERFEELLRRLRGGAMESSPVLGYTCYELVSGGPEPTYLLMLPASSIADLGAAPTTLSGLVDAVLSRTDAAAAQVEIVRIVLEISNETWRYQPDLSYFPEQD